MSLETDQLEALLTEAIGLARQLAHLAVQQYNPPFSVGTVVANLDEFEARVQRRRDLKGQVRV